MIDHTLRFVCRSSFAVILLTLLAACSNPRVPSTYTESQQIPRIFPEYHDVTVPKNIAPLTFTIEEEGTGFVTRITAGDREWVYAGTDVCPTKKQWEEMKQDERITVEVFTAKGDKWQRMKPFHIYVSPDSIDPYISYRLIAPSYVTYEDLTINQRCLENYDETLIYGNMSNSDETDGQCINCHAYQQYDPNRMQFHVRQAHGGTIIAYDGHLERVDMKTGKTVSAGVYPTWHPTEKLIAYSTNHTGQSFHTNDNQKVEVQDTYSDLMLYDIDRHEVLPLECDTNQLDCFPFWSPDGKFLYYCSAHYVKQDTARAISKEFDMIQHYKDVKYSLYRRAFDLPSRSFGKPEMVFDAAADSMSATLPRISPDGRWLMFTMGRFGVFHIWHVDADLYLMDLQQCTTEEHPVMPRRIDELNSDNVESYHSWSSNGRWVIFSSRRTDGNFTRPYIAHFDGKGHFSKPFELPQKDPHRHQEFLRSYNIPEFMSGPVTIRPQQFAAQVRKDSIKATAK
ncbi:MAG: PD40 domain-containing protein [Bacteroidaceae bacterium]|nr:PD40 domain-containing protein [Bacteroidaceae bacterium]